MTVCFVNFVREDRGLIPAKGASFQTRIYVPVKNIPTFGRVLLIMQPGLKKLLRRFYLVKRNVALKTGPMTSLLSRVDNNAIYSTTQFHNDISNL